MKSMYEYYMNIGLFGSYFNLILDKIGSNSDNVTLFTVFFIEVFPKGDYPQ